MFFVVIMYGKYIGLAENLVAHSWFEVTANLVVGVGGGIVAIQVAAEATRREKSGV